MAGGKCSACTALSFEQAFQHDSNRFRARKVPEWGYPYWSAQPDYGCHDMLSYCEHSAAGKDDKWSRTCAPHGTKVRLCSTITQYNVITNIIGDVEPCCMHIRNDAGGARRLKSLTRGCQGDLQAADGAGGPPWQVEQYTRDRLLAGRLKSETCSISLSTLLDCEVRKVVGAKPDAPHGSAFTRSVPLSCFLPTRIAVQHSRASGWWERIFDYTCDEPGAVSAQNGHPHMQPCTRPCFPAAQAHRTKQLSKSSEARVPTVRGDCLTTRCRELADTRSAWPVGTRYTRRTQSTRR